MFMDVSAVEALAKALDEKAELMKEVLEDFKRRSSSEVLEDGWGLLPFALDAKNAAIEAHGSATATVENMCTFLEGAARALRRNAAATKQADDQAAGQFHQGGAT